MIQIMAKVMQHPSQAARVLKPGNFETLKNLRKKINEKRNITTDGGDPTSVTWQDDAYDRNMAGKALVGVFANHNVHHAMIQQGDIAFSGNIALGGIKEPKLSHTDVRVAELLSSLVPASTDNAKDPVLGELNINLLTADLVAAMLRAKVPLEEIVYLLNTPKVREYSQRYFNAGGDFAAARKVALEMQKESGLGKSFWEKGNPKKASYEKDLNKGDYHEPLRDFLYYQRNHARPLAQLVSAMRFDNSYFGPTLADVQSKKAKVNKMYDPKFNKISGHLDFFNEESPVPGLTVFHEYGHAKPSTFVQEQGWFPFLSRSFESAQESLAAIADRSLSVDEIKRFQQDLSTYLLSDHPIFTRKVEKVAQRVNAAKANDKIKDLLFIKTLRVEKGSVLFRTELPMTPAQTAQMRHEWQWMMEQDGEVLALANDLAVYAYQTYGAAFKRGNFMQLLPVSFWAQPRLMPNGLEVSLADYLLQQQDHLDADGGYSDYALQYASMRPDMLTEAEGAVVADKTGRAVGMQIQLQENKDFLTLIKRTLGEDVQVYQLSNDAGYYTRIDALIAYDASLTGSLYNSDNSEAVDRVMQQKSSTSIPASDRLGQQLGVFAAKFNISIERIEDYQERYGKDSIAVANLFKRTIDIAQGKERLDTLPEEIAHFAEAMLPDAVGETLAKLARQHPLHAEVVKEYGDDPNYDEALLVRETVGKLLAREIVSEDHNGKSMLSRLLYNLWGRIKRFFGAMDQSNLDDAIQAAYGPIARAILNGDWKRFDESKLNAGSVVLHQKRVVTKQAFLESAIEKLAVKLKVLEVRDHKLRPNKQERLNELRQALDNKEIEKGIVDYVEVAASDLNQVKERLEELLEQGFDSSNAAMQARTLRVLQDYTLSYEPILSDLEVLLDNWPEADPEVKALVQDGHEIIRKVKNNYESLARPIVEDFLREASTNNVDFDQELQSTVRDVSFSRRWLDAMAESKDAVLGAVDISFKQRSNVMHQRATKYIQQLNMAQRKLDKAGIKTTDWMYQKVNGKVTRDMVQPGSEQHTEIMADPAKKAYYNVAAKMKFAGDQLLPAKVGAEMATKMPGVRKSPYERITQNKGVKGKWRALKDSIRDGLVRTEDDDDFGGRVMNDENKNRIKYVPTRFTSDIVEWVDKDGKHVPLANVDPDKHTAINKEATDLSTDATRAISLYYYEAAMTRVAIDVADVMELTADLLKSREVGKTTADKQVLDSVMGMLGIKKQATEKGTASLAVQRMTDYMDMNLYGEKKADEGTVWGMDRAKLVDTFSSYVSLKTLALNLYSATANATLGNAMVFIERVAGEFYTMKDWGFAHKTMMTDGLKSVGDHGRKSSQNKLILFFDKANTMQDLYARVAGSDNTAHTRLEQMAELGTLFVGQAAGEFQINGITALSLANRIKLKDKDGKSYNLYEAHEVVDGVLELKKGLTKEDGTLFTQKDFSRYVNRQNFVNKRLHGIYNDRDKAAFQKHSVGRLVSFYRKFLKPGINRRFESEYYNEEAETQVEGNYRTAGRWTRIIARDLWQKKFRYQAYKRKMSPMEKANLARTSTEAALILASLTLMTLLGKALEDDEDDWALNFAAYQANRMYSELFMWSNPLEWDKIIRTPAVGLSTGMQMFGAAFPLNWFKEIETGPNAGKTVSQKNVEHLIPLYRTIERITNPQQERSYYK